MEDNLKPCPFCGSKAHIVTYQGVEHIVYIKCDGCKVLMGHPRIVTSCLRGKLYFEDRNELIKAWNSRQ